MEPCSVALLNVPSTSSVATQELRLRTTRNATAVKMPSNVVTVSTMPSDNHWPNWSMH